MVASNLKSTITEYLLEQFKEDIDPEAEAIYKTFDAGDPEIEKDFEDQESINKVIGE